MYIRIYLIYSIYKLYKEARLDVFCEGDGFVRSALHVEQNFQNQGEGDS